MNGDLFVGALAVAAAARLTWAWAIAPATAGARQYQPRHARRDTPKTKELAT